MKVMVLNNILINFSQKNKFWKIKMKAKNKKTVNIKHKDCIW